MECTVYLLLLLFSIEADVPFVVAAIVQEVPSFKRGYLILYAHISDMHVKCGGILLYLYIYFCFFFILSLSFKIYFVFKGKFKYKIHDNSIYRVYCVEVTSFFFCWGEQVRMMRLFLSYYSFFFHSFFFVHRNAIPSHMRKEMAHTLKCTLSVVYVVFIAWGK